MWNNNKGLEGFIETKNTLPFEDEDLANNVPFVARASQPQRSALQIFLRLFLRHADDRGRGRGPFALL